MENITEKRATFLERRGLRRGQVRVHLHVPSVITPSLIETVHSRLQKPLNYPGFFLNARLWLAGLLFSFFLCYDVNLLILSVV